jgi:hypothetical protein
MTLQDGMLIQEAELPDEDKEHEARVVLLRT